MSKIFEISKTPSTRLKIFDHVEKDKSESGGIRKGTDYIRSVAQNFSAIVENWLEWPREGTK